MMSSFLEDTKEKKEEDGKQRPTGILYRCPGRTSVQKLLTITWLENFQFALWRVPPYSTIAWLPAWRCAKEEYNFRITREQIWFLQGRFPTLDCRKQPSWPERLRTIARSFETQDLVWYGIRRAINPSTVGCFSVTGNTCRCRHNIYNSERNNDKKETWDTVLGNKISITKIFESAVMLGRCVSALSYISRSSIGALRMLRFVSISSRAKVPLL